MKIQQIKRDGSAFQKPVDEQDLCLQLKRQLSGERIVAVTELQAGLFNNAYRVDTSHNAYVLKVAPEPGADVFYSERYLMQRERSVAAQLGSASPLIPEYLSFFNVGGRDAFLQPFVQGRLWSDVATSLSAAENRDLWVQLGRIARTLHSCRGERFGYPPPCEGFARWSGFITDNVDGLVEDCRRLDVLHEEVAVYRRYLPHFQHTLDQVTTANLLHGDLWPRNVIIDGTGADIHIKAVIDGERAFWGDPASDWVLILYGVPEAFWLGYGENLPQTRNPAGIAIYKGMYFILNILEAVRFQESDEAARNNLQAVNRALEGMLQEKNR